MLSSKTSCAILVPLLCYNNIEIGQLTINQYKFQIPAKIQLIVSIVKTSADFRAFEQWD